LREKGLSNRAIQAKLNVYLKGRKAQESASQLMTTVAQKMLTILDEIDLSKQIAKLPPQDKRKMN
jgi:hypothetical protein